MATSWLKDLRHPKDFNDLKDLTPQNLTTSPMNQRLLSLDTLRGFDMLVIMGGDAFFLCIGALLPGTIFADFPLPTENLLESLISKNYFRCFNN